MAAISHISSSRTSKGLTLASLPPEIVDLILDFAIPQPPEIGETKPVSYNQLIPNEPWFDFTRSRHGLWGLCLGSRAFSALAYPRLYSVMALLDEESMFLYFRTLAERPHYGTWTRYLSCHLTLTSEPVIRDTRRAVGRKLRTFRPASEPAVLMSAIRKALDIMAISLPHMSTVAGDFDYVPQVILAFILAFTPHLDTLLLQVPINEDYLDYSALFDKLHLIAGPRRHQHPHFATSPYQPPSPHPFNNLTTLLLQGDPELLEQYENSEDREFELPEIWGVQARCYLPLYECFPNLSTLEISTDDGVWSNLLDEEDLFLSSDSSHNHPYLNQIRHLYLHNSVTCPRNLHYVLRNAPRLQTLYMTPLRDRTYYRGPKEDSPDAHPEALDVALASHAPHLRHLDVAWFEVSGHEGMIGADGRLASLPRMHRLEKLCIQLAVLYGCSPATMETPLVELLPPNLVELALEDYWWWNLEDYDAMGEWTPRQKLAHYRGSKEYRNTALRMLAGLAESVGQRMPALKRVMLLCRIPWTWMIEDGVELDSHFDEVRTAFEAQGVEFLVDEV
ncbi:hypothetical protein B0T22DRAFT_472519 [Podospora appendiculata]|uniref:Uncharacterized protein n=1 Tax=Podospora appendiculata TaxID=314037 RepID=A0AAE0WYJ8_9PEZI|nr:hypothetical protein B0T22DRAFT_474543 [Podospora appendiculata]KAK3681597.1 hypothetical protein B0T22DRAFT_472519 [Podospora appendiculata]